ncbi:MAG TPA: RtcB family protein [Sedimentisphaerales bacterium]|nr:RtcB family protein [Sedimentisphaerales bacterium]
MEHKSLKRRSEYEWVIEPFGKMRVPAVIYADETLIKAMDEKVCQQATNVASLPGIVKASYAMPDAHWGYGFPIGGVAAFDPDNGGVVSAGGVGFDIACGVRTVTTGLTADDVVPVKKTIADLLARKIPAGLGSTGKLHFNKKQMDDVLAGGARWAVDRGYGTKEDLTRIEEHGAVSGADPAEVSDHAKKRQEDEVGTLGSGNHYLEVQQVTEIYDAKVAEAFGIRPGRIAISIHCGSRGLGHQVATEFLKKMATAAAGYGIELPERDLACAPIKSPVGQQYLGAMRSAINCALANRQILTHLLREVFASVFPKAELKLLYDVSHNTCKEETHAVNEQPKRLFIHRKGATRAFGPGDKNLPPELRSIGQPVLIGGTMGTASYILVGTSESMSLAFGSSCHGAGRSMSRTQASRQWQGRDVVKSLEQRGILIRCPSLRGVAEEAPGAYKDVSEVVEAAHNANLSRKVAKLVPLICIKG